MAVNLRFEVSSSSPDGGPFVSGHTNMHRGHFPGDPGLERGGSFHEKYEGRSFIKGGGGSGVFGSSNSGHADLQTLSQVLLLELLCSGEQKYARQLELKRAINAALGICGGDPMLGNLQAKPLDQLGPGELKRVRASIYDNLLRARDCSRLMTDAMSKLDKYRSSIHSQKRVRPESSVHERPITSLSLERSSTAVNSLKLCASPSRVNISDAITPKLEDRNKGSVPNKRVRTSMADLDGRQNALSLLKSSGMSERERDSFRSASTFGGQDEERDRLVATGSEGWEKTKMKGKRSGMKVDATAATTANGTSDRVREYKWGAQHRLNIDGRLRPSEGHGFRSGPVHGIVSMHKVEASVQHNGLAMRLVNRSESEDSPSMGEKGDRLVSLEKERSLLKTTVKMSQTDEIHSMNPTKVTKAKAARAPRSSSGTSVNPSLQAGQGSSSCDGWDRLAPNKPQLPVGLTNRKRPAPIGSSSPPVAQWVGQRTQKMVRVARRMNSVLPAGPVSNKDETLSMGEGACVRNVNGAMGAMSNLSMPGGLGFPQRVASTTTLSQIKPKNGRVGSSSGISESDESVGGDVKLKKGKRHGDSEGRFVAVNEKMGSIVLPAKKFHVVSKEGGDGVRRQGRSGRGLVAMRGNSTIPSVEKVDASTNPKHQRSARLGLEKPERPLGIKPGRPPTKKGVADRKTLTRPRRPIGSCAGDLPGESDDDHEELAAAVQEAVNASAAACSSSFWKQVEPCFAYLTQDDCEYLRQQVKELGSTVLSLNAPTCSERSEKIDAVQNPLPENPAANSIGKVGFLANGSMEVDGSLVPVFLNNLTDKVDRSDARERINSWKLPLSQRLLAALIIEGDSFEVSREDASQDDCARDGSPPSISVQSVTDRQLQELEAERGECRWSCGFKDQLCNNLSSSNGHISYDSVDTLHSGDLSDGDGILAHASTDIYSSEANADIGHVAEKYIYAGLRSQENQNFINQYGMWDAEYHQMNLDDRILLELQSIGLFPDPVVCKDGLTFGALKQLDLLQREDDEIDDELKKMQIELEGQICFNNEQIQALEAVISASRETEEREREHLAMTKLVEIAFNRRLGRGGTSGSSASKAPGSKGTKAAALAFAKRTLARWRNYVEFGQSCFMDSGLRGTLFCISSKETKEKVAANSGTAVISMNSENAGQLATLQGSEKTDKESSGSGHITTLLEQTGGREDIWSTRSKEREVLLEEVGGSSPVVGSSVLGGTKGKRSERERDSKSQNKEYAGNNTGRSLGSIKGERKTKTKPRQKAGPLLKAVNGLFGKPADLPKENTSTVLAVSENSVDKVMKSKGGLSLANHSDVKRPSPQGEGAIDLSHLQLPGMEDLSVTDDLGGQNQDLGSWLDFEDTGLQDAVGDFVGLDVPMDDLSDLAMMM